MCGVVGLKPTCGRLSIAGVVPLAWSLDHTGPLTKTVEDAALLLSVLAGFDPADAGSVDRPVPDFIAGLDAGVRGLRLGYFLDDRNGDLADAVRRNTEAAIAVLADLGARVEEIRLPLLEEAREVLWTIILGEAGAFHREWYETRPGDYGDDIRPHIAQGQTLSATEFVRALERRRLFVTGFREAMTGFDAVLSPALPMTAPRIGQETITLTGREEPVVAHVIRFFGPFNLTGLPAIAIPSGFDAAGLPTSLQIAGNAFDEATVLRVDRAYEAATEWRPRRPPI
jgi:aspartyl-tRNA(Asn)/glutamyl-tRNA(Gln) amidotransferase subunit A